MKWYTKTALIILILFLSLGLLRAHKTRTEINSTVTAPGSPLVNISTPPPYIPPLPSAELCAGLVTDKLNHPMTQSQKPAYLEPYKDPAFGTKVIRITNVNPSEGENAAIIPLYSTMQAWNADESLMILWHRGKGHELYNGKTYRFIKSLAIAPTDIEQILWDTTDPQIFYYPSNYNAVPNFMMYNVTNDKITVYANLGNICPTGDWGKLLSLGSDPMYMSWPPSKVIGMKCGDTKILFDIANKRVISTNVISNDNTIQVGPSGEYSLLGGVVYDKKLNFVRKLALPNPYEHSSVGSSNGHDTFNSVMFDGADPGTLETWYMDTGEHRNIIAESQGWPYPPSGTHISAVAYKRPGWVAVSVVGDVSGKTVLSQEIVLANTNDGTVCRLAHHHSYAGEGTWGYWAEPHVSISPSATRMIFASDWGNSQTVDTYVIELPEYSI